MATAIIVAYVLAAIVGIICLSICGVREKTEKRKEKTENRKQRKKKTEKKEKAERETVQTANENLDMNKE